MSIFTFFTDKTAATTYAAAYGQAEISEVTVLDLDGFQVETHRGQVVAKGEYNGYHDSDFYVVVWNGVIAAKIIYGGTSSWTYGNYARIDACQELRASYQAFLADEREIELIAWEIRRDEAAREAIAWEANLPSRGRVVTVTKGRTVPLGTTGEVIWHGEGKYGWRVGVKDAAGAVHWTAASNVTVTQPVRV